MAEKRMLSKVISVSEKVNELPDVFDMLLFTWLIPHTDDFGRIGGSAPKIKALVVPMLSKSIAEVKASLERLRDAGLISWYEGNEEMIVQITNFDKHQEGLKKKAPSKYPAPVGCHLPSNNTVLSASESEIEELLIIQLENNSLIENESIVTTERQLRVNNSYIDVLATGKSDRRYLFEVKRQRLSNAAIEQIIKYREILDDSKVSTVLIGNGLSSNFDMEKCRIERINVLVYDNNLLLDQLLLIDVKCREITLSSNRTELNRTEQNGTEVKGTNKQPHNFLPLINQLNLKCKGVWELEQVDSYLSTMDITLIEEALKRSEHKLSVAYALGILSDWLGKGFKTMDDIKPKAVPDRPKKVDPELESRNMEIARSQFIQAGGNPNEFRYNPPTSA